MSEYLMGIDIGSFESKGVVTRRDGTVVARAALKHQLAFLDGGRVEHDVETIWWGEFVSIARTLIRDARVDPSEIAAIGVSGVFSMVPVDADANPLRAGGIMYGIDKRSVVEIDEVIALHGEDQILRRTGNGISAQSMGPKILWLKNNEPEVHARAHSFLPCANFIVARLTGEFLIDHYTAGFYGPLYEPALGDWAPDLCRGIVDPAQMPRIKWASELAGHVTAKAADATGLAEGTPVTVGTSDAATEALSIGVTAPGDMMLMYGSSAWITLLLDKPKHDARLWASPYLFPGAYCLHGGMGTAGSVTRWMRDAVGADFLVTEEGGGPDAYAELTALAAGIPAGSEGLILLPYFSGGNTPIHDPHATGLLFGLTMQHTRAHLYRAALEGVGYAIQDTLQVMAQSGAAARLISAVGGGTKNPVWLQSVTDITGVPQQVPAVTLGASYGDAFLAGYAVGIFDDPSRIRDWASMARVIEPQPDTQEIYGAGFAKFKALYEHTRQLMR